MKRTTPDKPGPRDQHLWESINMTNANTIRVISYGAKSTKDERDAIPDQHRMIAEAVEQKSNRVIEGTYSDDYWSGYTSDRGPGLAEAIEHAKRLASEDFEVELWAAKPNRFARGDGIKARHLGALYFELRAVGVGLDCARGGDEVRDAVQVVMSGERAHKESKERGRDIADGMRRAAERGEPTSREPGEGYRYVYVNEADGKRPKLGFRRREFGDHEKVIRLILDDGLKGMTNYETALHLDELGHRAESGRPYSASRITQIWSDPIYAGLAIYKAEVVGEGDWPAFISPEDHERLKAKVAREKSSDRKRTPGRPHERALLAKVARCSLCNGGLTAIARKDNHRRQKYVCSAHKDQSPRSSAWCPAKPFDSETVDLALAEGLERVILDFDELQAGSTRTREVTMERAKREVERAEGDRKKITALIRRDKTVHAELDDPRELRASLNVIADGEAELEAAGVRLQAASDALEAVSGEPSLDPALDFMTRLRSELRGAVGRAGGDAKRLAEVVRSNFASVFLRHLEDGSIEIAPVLAPEAVERILGRLPAERLDAHTPTIDELDEMTLVQAPGTIAEWEKITKSYIEVAVPVPLEAINARPLISVA
jgi:hypothetical protein